MSYVQPFEITGFHSCEKSVGLKVLNGELSLTPSSNSWDWLGGGVYFWEQNPKRALSYARDSSMGIQKNKIQIVTPFVLGAVVELRNCLNLLEPGALNLLKEAFFGLKTLYLESGRSMPENKGPNRVLDCEVIKYLHRTRKLSGHVPFDSIRSSFHEHELLYPTANHTANLHIEVCVVNPECIKGYFLPRPVDMYNPYLWEEVSRS